MFQTIVVANIKRHILRSKTYFENLSVYEIMWRNTAQPDRTIWRMRTACCVPKATNPITEFVILIAFPPQQ